MKSRNIAAAMATASLIVAATLLSPGVFKSPVAHAFAPAPTPITSCGTYGSGNYVLANDLDPGSQTITNVCLIFTGKRGTTFDMQGHHIFCNPVGSGVPGNVFVNFAAIQLEGTGSSATRGIAITNGELGWCQVAIELLGTGYDTLDHVSVHDSCNNVHVFSPYNTVTNNHIFGDLCGSAGIYITYEGNVVDSNLVENNSCDGIYVDSGGYLQQIKAGKNPVYQQVYQQITNNTVTNNGVGSSCNGIEVAIDDPAHPEFSDYNLIQGNTATGNGTAGGFDLYDDHVGCANNQWVNNIYGTKNQACIN